jgi:hypothetical protein
MQGGSASGGFQQVVDGNVMVGKDKKSKKTKKDGLLLKQTIQQTRKFVVVKRV